MYIIKTLKNGRISVHTLNEFTREWVLDFARKGSIFVAAFTITNAL